MGTDVRNGEIPRTFTYSRNIERNFDGVSLRCSKGGIRLGLFVIVLCSPSSLLRSQFNILVYWLFSFLVCEGCCMRCCTSSISLKRVGKALFGVENYVDKHFNLWITKCFHTECAELSQQDISEA